MLQLQSYRIFSIPNGFEYELLTMRPFFQDQGVKRRNSAKPRNSTNADIVKMGSNKWVTLKCAGYKHELMSVLL